MFQSSRLASLITVQDSEFEEDIEETTSIKDIALMDTDSAAIIGNRTMGTLEKYVSQFVVWNTYSTISYNGKPMKVAPLEYNGLFKYNNNKINGIPGYILVDPVSGNSEFVELEEGIKYSPSAYFANDLRRAVI